MGSVWETEPKQGTVTASLMMKKLASYPKQNGFAKALRGIGRTERALFMLDWFRDPSLRRRVQAGLIKVRPAMRLHERSLCTGYGLWFRGIKRLPGVAVASLGLLSPLVAVLLGWAILSQAFSGIALSGLIIVLTSVLIVQRTSAS